MTETETRILKVVRSLAELEDVNPAPDQSLFDGGILDSFGLPDLVSALETEFGVTIPDSDLLPANFNSLHVIDAYLSKISA